MTVSDYLVELGLFGGPLDLLLFLVRKGEIEATDVPVAKVAQDFLAQIEAWDAPDFELAGDVVVTASALAEIKSREALPKEEEPEEESISEVVEAPASEIVERLLIYKKFKLAAVELEEQAAHWRERYARLSDDRPKTERDPATDRIKEVELWDLVAALSRVLETAEPELSAAAHLHALPHLKLDNTPIGVYSERIRERITKEQRVAFSSFFEGEKNRAKIVGIFLAILELLRHHNYRAEQTGDFGEIWVLPPAG